MTAFLIENIAPLMFVPPSFHWYVTVTVGVPL